MLDELKGIRIEDYDYPLPDERIARYPLEERDHSKLLCLKDGLVSEHHFYDLPTLLPADSLLVFNNTKVIHARLLFHKETGAVIEIFCLEPHNQDVTAAFAQHERCTWTCFIGNNKKWKEGPLSGKWKAESGEFCLTAERRMAVGNAWIVDFCWTGGHSFAEVIEAAGVIPLPPYLNREAEESDAVRYQTVYALHDGSVAAPTAGLHFTPEVLASLKEKGIGTEYLTLHVGAGTFKPVNTDTIGEHEMHVEKVQVTADNLQHILAHTGRPLIAVGTTSVRTLESLYWFGVMLRDNPDMKMMHVSQWDPYTLDPQDMSLTEAYNNILRWMENQGTDRLDGETQLMIAPGYRYRVVNGLVTNFHQPKSTLLLLVAALIGDRWHECYRYALDHGFRFLSYGDSCFFMP
ncbi:MAG: S-adenosylmethionine:tRNA ribosyltransferase-isomerase [Bacteroidales bacterium]|nr:S-adenosylmethionine:tRNA ribosyltransferase-isomerase [Bacteroidales bacterium]